MIDFSQGVEVHKKLFPLATKSSQIIQLNEELEELDNAETNEEVQEETGDVLVVAVSLLRFEETRQIGAFILQKFYFDYGVEEQKKRLKWFNDSLEKCKKRISDERYYYINGLYKRNKNFHKGGVK